MEGELTIILKIYSLKMIDPDRKHKIILNLNSILICYIHILKILG